MVHWSEGGGYPVAEQFIVMSSFSGTNASDVGKPSSLGGTAYEIQKSGINEVALILKYTNHLLVDVHYCYHFQLC